jgi:hypothetical protein
MTHLAALLLTFLASLLVALAIISTIALGLTLVAHVLGAA